MFYKIINQHIDVPYNHILQKPFNFTRSGNRKFLHLPSRIDSFKYFFPQSHQNHLPDYIVETDINIDTFKHLLTS